MQTLVDIPEAPLALHHINIVQALTLVTPNTRDFVSGDIGVRVLTSSNSSL